MAPSESGADAAAPQVNGHAHDEVDGHDEHAHEHHHGHDGVCEHHHQGPFDLAILVPRTSFTSAGAARAIASTSSSDKSANLLEDHVCLYLPAGNTEVLRDIRQSVTESAEGFWIGAHSFQRISIREEEPAAEGQEPKLVLDGEPSEIFPETADLATVFAGEEYKNPETRRALKAVEVPYTDMEARAHVMRVRDASLSYTAALHSRRMYQPAPYDPNALTIDGGLSLYTALRGPLAEETPLVQAGTSEAETQTNGTAADAQSSKTSKKSKGKASKAKASPTEPASPVPTPAPANKAITLPSASFLDVEQDPLAVHLSRKSLLSQSSLPPPAFKNLQLSVWNPPPQHLRLRGHFLYMTVTTLEGETHHITAAHDGFYISKSDNQHFDPQTKSQQALSKSRPHAHLTHHTLFGLLSALSPQFAQRTQTLIAEVAPQTLDFFASIAITNCLPAAPWMVPVPEPVADGARSQTAYLLTGATNAELLPNARDWNEELTSMRELPRATNEDKLIRDRYASRLHADFQAAAARGVASIARGDIAPLNPLDAGEASSYLAYNILFTQAQDSADTYKHLGGDEAARVTASKDVWATKLLADANIPNLHTVATAVVDYGGERWIAQAIPPGIFNKAPEEVKPEAEAAKDAPETNGETAKVDGGSEDTPADASVEKKSQAGGLRAVYGPVNTDKPHDEYIADASFEPLAKKIAEHFHLAKHTVTDTQGRETEMWTPADVHGLVGADSRMYAIDLFRLTPVDVNFLEKDYKTLVNSEGSADTEAYPHRATLLRPELVELYHNIKTREWIEQQVNEKTAAEKTDSTEETATAATAENGDDSIEKPESATSEDFVKVDKEAEASAEDAVATKDKSPEKKQTVINVGDFKLAFNPDAFVDRPDKAQAYWMEKSDDNVDEGTKAVRAAGDYLRSSVIPSLMREIIAEETIPLDSSELSRMLHRRGINMRYLGHLAEACKQAPPSSNGTTRSSEAEQEVLNFLAKFRVCLVNDMILRGAKHVFRRLVAGLAGLELAEAVSHFLNCFLGTSVAAHPKGSNSTRSKKDWTTLTPEALHQQIAVEVKRRFRFVLPEGALEQSFSKPRMLRELCIVAGLQINLRSYNFEGKSQVNGAISEASNDSKKQAGKKAGASSPTLSASQTTFTSEDILNIYPVVKKAPFRSAITEDLFEKGQIHHIRGNLEHGESYLSDALNFYDQIYGAVHPEMAEAYRLVGSMYHRMSSPMMRRIQLYEQLSSIAREEDRERIRKETGIESDEALEQAKIQHELYLQQAVKLTRQAVVISERVHGIDASETLHCYSELALFEHAIGNIELALKLLQHSVALTTAIYGDNHPEKARAAYFAASMVKQAPGQNQVGAVPFFKSAQGLANKAYGSNSIMSANSSYQLAQCYIVDGQLSESIPYIEEASRIFDLRLGKESENARDASQLLAVVKSAIEQKEKGELEKVQKLAKRIGADPARAKELIGRMQSGSSAAARRGGRSSAQLAASDAAAASNGTVTSAADKTGNKGHLDVDDLVLFIEGGPRKSSPKSGKAKKSSSKK